MWKPCRQALLAALALAVVVTGAAAAGATPGPSASQVTASSDDDRPADPSQTLDIAAWDRAGTVGLGATGHGTRTSAGKDTAPIRTFVGQDGVTYPASPSLVEGANETVFFGEEFDAACAFGTRFDKGMVRIARLARMIEASGRRVVFSVAPNKSAVNKADLAGVQLPHGYCDSQGIARQDRTLDRFRDDNYLPTRHKLARRSAGGVGEYWRVDTHWTSIGATHWAHDLAKRLDPRLARKQSYRRDTESLQVDLSFLGLTGQIIETALGRKTTTKVNVTPKPGTSVFDPNLPSPTVAWSSAPKQRTWRGHTLLLGDSFTYRSMDALMPLFAHGQFLWIGHAPAKAIADEIADSNTVVIEVVQRYVAASLLTMRSFQKVVRKTLRKHPR
jgi:hypothetical protein